MHPRCDCQHNTAGMNCERCDDLFNDLPWRPAEEGNTHTCQRMNLHAPTTYLCREWRERFFFSHSKHFMCVFSPGCECNGHAQRCYFDLATYEASGRRSGGVCEGCMHHTTGPKCDRCAPGYQRNPRSQMDRPDACIRKRFTSPLQTRPSVPTVGYVNTHTFAVAARVSLQH